MNTAYVESLHLGELVKLSQLSDKTTDGIVAKATASLRLGKFSDASLTLSTLETDDPMLKLETVILFSDIIQGSGKHEEAYNTLKGIVPSRDLPAYHRALLSARRGELLQLLQRDEEALEEYTSALNELFTAIKASSGATDAEEKLSKRDDLLLAVLEGVMNATRNLGIESEAELAIERLLEHAEQRASHSRLPLIISQAAEYLSLFGESEDYAHFFAAALRLSQEKGWRWDEAHVRLITGRIAEFSGMEEMAIEQTLASQTIFNSIGALPSELAAADQLAAIYANLGRGQDAMQTYTTVVDRARQLGDVYMLINSISQVCTLAFELDETYIALDYLVMLMEESTKLSIRPPAMIALLREAWSVLPADVVRAKLGLDKEDGEFGL